MRRGDGLELWSGLRRAPRQTAPVPPRAELVEGEAVVLDAAGAPVLRLFPLAQIAAPAPGASDEMFLLEGRGRSGAALSAPPAGFEREDPELWGWFARELLDDERDGAAAPDERSPYRGLAPFAQGDADLYVGREVEASAFLNRLRVSSFLAVVGPSGAGKSSFVFAGVVPRLPAGWRAIGMRPGTSPETALAARWPRDLRPDTTPVLIVDQLEELFTLCPDPAQRERFAEILVTLAATGTRVVVTLRDDFLVRAEALPALRERLAQGLTILTTPSRAALLRMLVEPARRAGYGFEDDALPAEMTAAVVDQPGALALLSFTAAQLWELRDRHFRHLSRRAYEALGGVGGALAQHAEATLAAMPADRRDLVRQAMRALVTAEGTRATLPRADLEHLLGGGTRATAVIEQLVDARLLAAGDDGSVEVIHEALLGAWPRLVAWRREDAEGATLRDQLRAAARQWHERNRAGGLLWRDDALGELRRWRARWPGSLSPVEEAFAAASLEAEARAGRRRRRLVIGGFAALLAVAVVLFVQGRAAERARGDARAAAARAEATVTDLYLEQGRQALLAGRAPEALAGLALAWERGARGPALELMLTLASRPVRARLLSVAGGVAAWAPGGGAFVTGDDTGVLRVRDGTRGTVTRQVGLGGPIASLAYSADGNAVLARLSDAAFLVDAATAAITLKVTVPGRLIPEAQLAGPGMVLVVDSEGQVSLHDGRSARWSAGPGRGYPWPVKGARAAVAGGRAITAMDYGAVQLWSVADGAVLARLEGHRGHVNGVAFTRDGRVAASAGDDRTARLWDGLTGAPLAVLEGHQARVTSVVFSDDGEVLLTASEDGTARAWSVPSGRLLVSFIGHAGPVLAARFAGPDRVVTAGGDRTVRVWDRRDGTPVASLAGHLAGVADVAVASSGSRILAASRDGTSSVWALGGEHDTVHALDGHDGLVFAPVFSRDGAFLATAGADGVVRLRDGGGRLLFQIPHPQAVTSVAFSPDGTRLVTLSEDGLARVFTTRDGRPGAVVEHGGKPVRWAEVLGDGSVLSFPEAGPPRRWDLETGAIRRDFAPPLGDVSAVAVQPGGALAAATVFGVGIQLWDVAGSGLVGQLATGHADEPRLAFSADGRTLLCTDAPGDAQLWDVATRRRVWRSPDGGVSVGRFSPDGDVFAIAGEDARVHLWRRSDQTRGATLDGHSSRVSALLFSADGELVFTASRDHTAMIWERATGRPIAVLAAHATRISGLALSPDGGRLVTTGADGSVKLWDLAHDAKSAQRIVECSPVRRQQAELRWVDRCGVW